MSQSLSEQVAELEAERDEELVKWKKLEADLTTEVFALIAERDGLKARLQFEKAERALDEANRELNGIPRIITADELREGQVIAIHDIETGDVTGGSVLRLWGDGHAVRLKGQGGNILNLDESEVDTIVLLAETPEHEKPELPTEPGSVVLVTEWEGEKLDPPFYAVRGPAMWLSISGGAFPGGFDLAQPSEITGWKNARIVVEDGEA